MVFTNAQLAVFEEDAKRTAELSPKEATLLLQRIGIVTKRGVVSKRLNPRRPRQKAPTKKK